MAMGERVSNGTATTRLVERGSFWYVLEMVLVLLRGPVRHASS
jgi:hypothetical protein